MISLIVFGLNNREVASRSITFLGLNLMFSPARPRTRRLRPRPPLGIWIGSQLLRCKPIRSQITRNQEGEDFKWWTPIEKSPVRPTVPREKATGFQRQPYRFQKAAARFVAWVRSSPPTPFTGTGSMSVPLGTSHARSGFGPHLYDSGANPQLIGKPQQAS